VVETVYAVAEAPEVIVYVDQKGNPVSTTTQPASAAPSIWSHGGLSTIFPSSSSIPPPVASSPPSSIAVAPPVVEDTQAVASTSAAPVRATLAVASSAPASAPAPVASSSSPGSSGHGVSYSPYFANGDCKGQAQVDQDVAAFASTYSMVRIYGTSCNQTATVLQACKQNNLKLFAGVSDLGALNSEIQLIVEAANGDWSNFDTISIGNELVNSGAASPSAVVAAIGTARGLLGAASYPGKIVTVDTLVATVANPILCHNSDYCAVNNHPFFDPNTAPSGVSTFLENSVASLLALVEGKEIVITETGWPTCGSANGAAVPSLANQASALSQIKSAYSNAIILSAYNDLWKTNTANTFGAEQCWGVGGADAPSG